MNSNSIKLPYIGVDIGGSHITAAHVDATTFKVIENTLKRERVAAMDTLEVIIQSWLNVLSALIVRNNGESTKIGIAMPGPFDYEKGISMMQNQEKYDALYGVNVKEILAERLEIPASDIVFINDAEAFLRGELASGAAADKERAIGITLGTGLGSTSNGSGITRDMNWAFRPFKDSIAEEYISTRWFLKKYKEITGKEVKNVEVLLEVADQAVKNEIFEEFSDNLGIFLNDFIAQEQPQVVVIGGNIAKTWDHFIELLTAKIKDKTVAIRQSEMWEDAALVGAANALA
ncbi:ROK family transcriptional regulator [Pedobacter sp. PACM 27299]|uniref:ROK family protein n=1 Tax=Pedobacter sp. PACM 27299 TaxID=1727164 RepID=UPI000705F786|nr:ROK family protein [Pedobacter sp. PACM 27299]ALL07951.1 ROK family transcriptional regulator [Pedobacter sp. PACM 27299]